MPTKRFLGGLVEIYPGWQWQLRVWRARLYVNTEPGLRLGAAIYGPIPGFELQLIKCRITLYLWSHCDDCECDQCRPF